MAFQNLRNTSTPQTNTKKDLLYAAIPGVLGGLSSWLTGNQQQGLTEEQMAFQGRENALDRTQRQAEQQAASTQLDPLKQQKSRQLNALVSSLLSSYTPSTMDNPGSGLKYNFGDIASFFSPEARSNAEQQFVSNVRPATGNQYVGPSGVGYGDAYTAPADTPAAGDDWTANWQDRTDYSDPNDTQGGGVLGGVGTGAGLGATLGSVIPGVGTAIGGGLGALVGGIGGAFGANKNDTKSSREALSASLGLGGLDNLYNALRAAGPEGAALVDAALNKIGRKDVTAQTAWDQSARRVLSGARPPAPQPATTHTLMPRNQTMRQLLRQRGTDNG